MTQRQARNAKDLSLHRKVEAPLHKNARSVQETIDLLRVYGDGIFEACPHVYSVSYIFSSGQYNLKSDEERIETARNDTDLKNGLGADLQYTYITRPLVNENVSARLQLPKEEGCELTERFNELVTKKVSAAMGKWEHLTLITMSVRANTIKQAEVLLAQKESVLQSRLALVGARISRISTTERLRLLRVFYGTERAATAAVAKKTKPYAAAAVTVAAAPDRESLRDFRNDIAPVRLVQYKDRIELPHKLTRVLFAAQYPEESIEDDFMHALASQPYEMIVSAHLTQIPRNAVAARLADIDYNVTRRAQKEQKRNNKEKLFDSGLSTFTQEAQKAEKLLREGYRTEKKMFFASLTIALSAQTQEALDEQTEALMALGDEYSVRLEIEEARQREGLSTALPLGARFTKTMRAMYTSSTFLFHPYWCTELFEEGICYGIDRIGSRPIQTDRRTLYNPHALVFGTSGASKSGTVKTEILQVLKKRMGKVIIFDPTNEYAPLVSALGGTYIDLSLSSGVRINPLEIPFGTAFMREDFIARKSELMRAILRARMDTAGTLHEAVVDDSVAALYSFFLSDRNKKGKQKQEQEQPLMSDFVNQIQEYPERERQRSGAERVSANHVKLAEEVALAFSVLTSGTVRLFSEESNINLWNADLVVVGTKHAGKLLFDVMTIVFFDYVETVGMRHLAQGGMTYFYIDELHELLKNPVIADDLTTRWKVGRHNGLILTGILQDVTDVRDNPTAKHLLTNSATVFILRQQVENLKIIRTECGMSESEAAYAASCPQGCGVVKFADCVLPFDFAVPETLRQGALWEILNTDTVR